MKIKTVLAACALVCVGACATTKQWTATGGSRSDGIVRLSYEEGMFEKAKLNEQQALETAIARCKVWGYSNAEAFGGVTSQCNSYSQYGCANRIVTKEYQCTGDRAAPAN